MNIKQNQTSGAILTGCDNIKENPTGAGAGEWVVRGVAWVGGFPEWTAARFVCVQPVRGGRGAIGTGGGGGALVRTSARADGGAGVGKVVSTRGGAGVRDFERARAAADWSAWFTGWRAGAAGAAGDSMLAAVYGDASGVSIACALASGVTLGAAGGFLADIQAAADLVICERAAQRLGARMLRDGKIASSATLAAAAADAAADVHKLRADGWQFNLHLAAWQFVSRAVSADGFGDDVQFFEPDVLADLRASSLPLPQLLGDDSRGDAASRLLFERARAKRPALLARRLQFMAAGVTHHARKVALQKCGVVAARVLAGDDLTTAAAAGGFKSAAARAGGGARSADDSALRAVLRIVGDGGARLARGERARDVVGAWRVVRRVYPVAFAAGESIGAAARLDFRRAAMLARGRRFGVVSLPVAAGAAARVAVDVHASGAGGVACDLVRRVWVLPVRGARVEWCAAGWQAARRARAAMLRAMRAELARDASGKVLRDASGAARRAYRFNLGARADWQAAARRGDEAARVAAAVAGCAPQVFTAADVRGVWFDGDWRLQFKRAPLGQLAVLAAAAVNQRAAQAQAAARAAGDAARLAARRPVIVARMVAAAARAKRAAAAAGVVAAEFKAAAAAVAVDTSGAVAAARLVARGDAARVTAARMLRDARQWQARAARAAADWQAAADYADKRAAAVAAVAV